MKYLLPILIIALILPLASADIYKQSEILDLKVPCFYNNTYCESTTTCNLTVTYNQNKTVLINGKAMQNQGTYFNYTLSASQTGVTGEYTAITTCNDIESNGYAKIDYEITLTGKTSSSPVSGWVIFGIVILLFIISAALFIFGITASPSNPQARVIIRGIFIAGGLLFLLVTLHTLNITAEEYIQMPAITSLLNRLITISSILIPAVFFFIIIAQLKMAADEIKETARGY